MTGFAPFGPMARAVFPHKRKQSVSVNPATRAAVIQRDGPICFYCQRGLSDIEITMDHVRPRAKGGTGEAANIRVACMPCNSSKRTRAWPYADVCPRPCP